MRDPDTATTDEQAEQALDDLIRATDAFVTSWTDAVRRFATEPPALTRFRATHPPGLAFLDSGTRRASPATIRPWEHPHPLWDRDLDG